MFLEQLFQVFVAVVSSCLKVCDEIEQLDFKNNLNYRFQTSVSLTFMLKIIKKLLIYALTVFGIRAAFSVLAYMWSFCVCLWVLKKRQGGKWLLCGRVNLHSFRRVRELYGYSSCGAYVLYVGKVDALRIGACEFSHQSVGETPRERFLVRSCVFFTVGLLSHSLQ